MEDQLIDYDKYKVGEIATLLTQRDNQAYTSLVEGIEGMKHTKRLYRNEQGAIEDVSTNAEIERNDILTDILENVVKPIYGKEYIMTQETMQVKPTKWSTRRWRSRWRSLWIVGGITLTDIYVVRGLVALVTGLKLMLR